MLNETVTSALVGLLKVAVNVKDDPAFSAILVADVARVTEGAASPSAEIVIVSDCVPLSVASAPETDEIEIIAVSSASKILSSVGVNEAVPVVDPAETVISDTVL